MSLFHLHRRVPSWLSDINILLVSRMHGIWTLLVAAITFPLKVVKSFITTLHSQWLSWRYLTRWNHPLDIAQTFDEWMEAAVQVDRHLKNDVWRHEETHRQYNSKIVRRRLEGFENAIRDHDTEGVIELFRWGLVRNMVNVTTPSLYMHAYSGTKDLIDAYIDGVVAAIHYIADLEPAPHGQQGLTMQRKLQLLHDARLQLGRTSLLLQGGSLFTLCHLGVVKALYLQGLLPRIITGSGTGALVAALIGVRTEDELQSFFDDEGIDFTALVKAGSRDKDPFISRFIGVKWLRNLTRRIYQNTRRWLFVDINNILEEYMRSNLGNTTFEEAYEHSKRIINITVATSHGRENPTVLNYMTAPNVIIASAAAASNASVPTILYKNRSGDIVAWHNNKNATFVSSHDAPQARYQQDGRHLPLASIAEMFNVNHFVISRPRLNPLGAEQSFLDRRSPRSCGKTLVRLIVRLALYELRHRLGHLDRLGALPRTLARLFVEERVPGPDNLTILPAVGVSDMPRLLGRPSREDLELWVLKGERGVWPAVSALRARLLIEMQLDRAYERVRVLKPAGH